MRRSSLTLSSSCSSLLFRQRPPSSPPSTASCTIQPTAPSPARKSPCRQTDSAFVLHATTAANGEFELPQAPIGVYRLRVSAPGFADSLAIDHHRLRHQSCPSHSAVSRRPQPSPWSSTPPTAPHSATDTVTPTTLITRQNDRRNSRRQPHHGHGDDHRLRARLLHDPRHAPHARRPSDQLAHRRRLHPQHQDRFQCRPADRPQRHRLSSKRSAAVTPPTSAIAPMASSMFCLAMALSVTAKPSCSYPPAISTPAKPNSPSATTPRNSLVCKPHRLPLQLRPRHAGLPDSSTTPPTPAAPSLSLIRNQTAKDQLRARRAIPSGFLPDSLRSRPERLRMHLRLLLLLRPARRPNRARLLRHRQLGSHAFTQSTLLLRALLPLQPVQLRFAIYRLPSRNYLAPELQLRRWSGGHTRTISAPTASPAASTRSTIRERPLRRRHQRRLSALPAQFATPTPTRHSSSSTSPIICASARYVTLLGGERFSILHAGLDETAIYPRIGATVDIPRLHWVLRGFYGHFFQPAPIRNRLRVSSQLRHQSARWRKCLHSASLRARRRTSVRHRRSLGAAGCSTSTTSRTASTTSSTTPISANPTSTSPSPSTARWFAPGSSPSARRRLAHFGQFHLAYSNQIAEQRGNVIGGFTCSATTDPACDLGPDYTPVDHDQRNTLNTGFTANLPLHTWFASNVYYGSGFTNGLAGSGQGPYQGPYLPVHTTFDVSAGQNFGENWNLTANILNVTNHRVCSTTPSLSADSTSTIRAWSPPSSATVSISEKRKLPHPSFKAGWSF